MLMGHGEHEWLDICAAAFGGQRFSCELLKRIPPGTLVPPDEKSREIDEMAHRFLGYPEAVGDELYWLSETVEVDESISSLIKTDGETGGGLLALTGRRVIYTYSSPPDDKRESELQEYAYEDLIAAESEDVTLTLVTFDEDRVEIEGVTPAESAAATAREIQSHIP